MRELLFPLFLFLAPMAFTAERFDSLPFVSGDTFRSFADFIYDDELQSMDPDSVREGDIVFLAPTNPIVMHSTLDLLFDQLAQIKKKNFNYDKLLFRYWSDLIIQTQRDCRENQTQQIS